MDKWRGVKNLKSQKKLKIKQVIQPSRAGKIYGYPCSLAWNPKTHRYDLRIADELAFSSVSYGACLRAAEREEITWGDNE